MRQALVSALIVLGVGLAVVLFGLKLAGWQSLTVLTGSMSPTIVPGQVIVVSPQAATKIRPGQVITFKRPTGIGTLTHRVQTVAHLPGQELEVTTKGDANTGSETWRIREGGTVGIHRATLPAVGGTASLLVSGPGRPFFVGGVALIAVLLVLRWIWLPERDPHDDADAPSVAVR